MGKLFGTDGIRGKANQWPMTHELARAVGAAVASIYKKDHGRSKIILGRDTRQSGPMLEAALTDGICAQGVDALSIGVAPTPGLAYAVDALEAQAGIMISASHNPFEDNGLKIFGPKGYKLTDLQEQTLEPLILQQDGMPTEKNAHDIGQVLPSPAALEAYADFLCGSLNSPEGLDGLKIVLDCSHGATYQIAPDIFSRLGAEVTPLFTQPDGTNINTACGSQHPEQLQHQVVALGATVGFAFDGDGDRVISVDEKGQILTGDQMMVVCAKALNHANRLKNNLVVSTVMSNFGFGKALQSMGIDCIHTQVGDRYVLEKMLATGAVLGGEDSGHMIFLEHHSTGDGILSALQLLNAMHELSQPLSELRDLMVTLPQVLQNVTVNSQPEIGSIPAIAQAIETAEQELAGEGRVLVRYSGTEPLCRVMVEGPTMELTERICDHLCEIIQSKIGIG